MKIYCVILLVTIIGEFLVPYFLAKFYENYDSRMLVMSVLGCSQSPVRLYYNLWLIWLGITLCCSAVVFFHMVKDISFVLACLIGLVIIIFGIGAGILAGLFSVNETKEMTTRASQIHGYGSAIGFMALLFLPLLFAINFFMGHDMLGGWICLVAFFGALFFFVCFIMGDKARFHNTIIAYEGLWERLSLLAMYVPFLYVSLSQICF